MATFDDYRPLAAIPVPAAMIAAVSTELGPCSTVFVAITIFTSVAVVVAANANANAKILGASDGRCRKGNRCKCCKRETKLSHFDPLLDY
jgi:hypothetical protein